MIFHLLYIVILTMILKNRGFFGLYRHEMGYMLHDLKLGKQSKQIGIKT